MTVKVFGAHRKGLAFIFPIIYLPNNRSQLTILRIAFCDLWTLPRAKNCSPALNFCTSLRTGAALSSPFPPEGRNKREDTLMGILSFICIWAYILIENLQGGSLFSGRGFTPTQRGFIWGLGGSQTVSAIILLYFP